MGEIHVGRRHGLFGLGLAACGALMASVATLKVVNAAAVPKGVRQDLVVADGIRRGFARVSSDREDLFEIVLKGLAYIGRSLSGLYLIFR